MLLNKKQRYDRKNRVKILCLTRNITSHILILISIDTWFWWYLVPYRLKYMVHDEIKTIHKTPHIHFAPLDRKSSVISLSPSMEWCYSAYNDLKLYLRSCLNTCLVCAIFHSSKNLSFIELIIILITLPTAWAKNRT